MQLSLKTIHILAGAEDQESKRAIDSMIQQAYEHFVKPRVHKKKRKNQKLYFSFRTFEGKIFLETETRPKK